MRKIDLSIAIITFNRAKELLRAVESCMPYITTQMELVIWDNCSEDNSEELLNQFMSGHSIIYKYIRADRNYGVAEGRNRIFRETKGRYVFFLDDDAVLVSTENYFNELCSFMDKNPEVAVASVSIYEPDSGRVLDCSYNERSSEDYVRILMYNGGAHIIRRSVVNNNDPLYPPNLMFGSEEFYFSLRQWEAKRVVAGYYNLVVEHLPSVINRYEGKSRDFNLIVNQYVIKKMTLPIPVLGFTWVAFLLHLIKNGFFTFSSLRKAKQMIVERNTSSARKRISMATWLDLIRRFGIKPLI